MPKLLKRDSIRLIESSIECLALAQLGICSFHRTNQKQEIVRYSPETGLVGSSIELAMSSVLVQAFDRKVVMKTKERFKTASEILQDFRSLLRQNSANLVFLKNGVDKPEEHINKLLELTSRFKVLIIARANALHSGIGLNYDVIASIFQEVSMFIRLLAKSINYKPYIPEVPKLITISKEKNILIEELFENVETETTIENQKTNIASLFLLLPEVPNELPEWVSKFENFNIAPKEKDIVYLTKALRNANPVELKRTKKATGTTLVTRIDKTDPNAIPIKPHYLKSEFTEFKDSFYADIANANGRLKKKQLDLPPDISVMRTFAFGLKELSLLEEGQEYLTAHQTWPTISRALKVNSTGINFPLWFIVRKTSDLGQLIGILRDSKKISNDSYKNNVDDVIIGIKAIKDERKITTARPYYSKIMRNYASIQTLQKNIKFKSSNYDLESYYPGMEELFTEDELSVEDIIKILLEDGAIDSLEERKYWLNKFAGTVLDLETMPLLYEIYENPDYNTNKTQIKKNMTVTDFITFGPTIKND